MVVVFATPPFWLANAITRAKVGPFAAFARVLGRGSSLARAMTPRDSMVPSALLSSRISRRGCRIARRRRSGAPRSAAAKSVPREPGGVRLGRLGFRFVPIGDHDRILAKDNDVPEVSALTGHRRKGASVSLLWIILIVILVLALLGFFTRGRW